MATVPISTRAAPGTVLGTHDEAAAGIPIAAQLIDLDRTGGGPFIAGAPTGVLLAPAARVLPGRLRAATVALRATFGALPVSSGGVVVSSGGAVGSGGTASPISQVGFSTVDLGTYPGGAAVSHKVCAGWDGTQIYRAACITLLPLSTDATPAGKRVVQIVNAPGDSPVPPGSPNTRRTEFVNLRDVLGNIITETASDSLVWYDWVWKFPSGWNAPAIIGNPDNWAIIVQLHSDDNLHASPPFALDYGILTAGQDPVLSGALDGGDIVNGQTFVRLRFLGNTTNTTPGSTALGALRPECAGETPISPADAERGDPDNWLRLQAGIKWATDNTGSVTIQRQNRLTGQWQTVASKQNYTTLQWNSGVAGQVDANGKPTPTPHYWKQGLYIGDHPDSNVSDKTFTFRVGPFSRGVSQAQVRAYGG